MSVVLVWDPAEIEPETRACRTMVQVLHVEGHGEQKKEARKKVGQYMAHYQDPECKFHQNLEIYSLTGPQRFKLVVIL